MATFSSLFNKQMKKGNNPFDAATAAYNDTIKDMLGISKKGFLGSFMSSKSGKKDDSLSSPSVNSNLRIAAKNSMFLPVIAKEMNIMRQNIQLMVKKQGLTPKTKATLSVPTSSSVPPSSSKSSKGGFFESAGSTLSSVGGGMLSVTSGILSGLFGVLGAAGSSFLSMFSGLAGKSPLLLLAGGYLVSVLYRAIPFKKVGEDFSNIFSDILTRLSEFFGIDGLKKSFGMKEGEGFFSFIAKKLDDAFNTSFFTTNLEKAGKTLSDAADDAGIFLKNAYRSVMNYVNATISTTMDVMKALTSDVKTYLLLWLDGNRKELYSIIGGAIGTVVGSVVPGVGSAIGAVLGAGIGYGLGANENYVNAELVEKNVKTFGSVDTALSKTDQAANIIHKMLADNKNAGLFDFSNINPLLDKNKEKFDALSLITGRNYKLDFIINGPQDFMGFTKILKEDLIEIQKSVGALSMEKIKNEGANALKSVNLLDRFYTNLGNEQSENPPITKNPTRIFSPVGNSKTPTGSQAYGAGRDNHLGKYEHGGVDYLGKIGDPIYAMQDGKVELREQPNGLGKYIVIRGKDGFSTVYGHLSKSIVPIGSEVTYGQKIGEMGDSGNATKKPQLHFEVYRGEPFNKSGRLNPLDYLEGRMLGAPTMENTAADNSNTNVISDVAASTKENIIDPLVKKFDEMIAAFLGKDTNVVVNTSSESGVAEAYSEEQLANYKLSGINF
jgi:murein DD-endopeptidase MepM/ murein hydrolase activator NlpD/DNA-binding phage protein